MSGQFSFDVAPPEQWNSHCAAHNALFHSQAWQNLLEQAFGCHTLYGWCPESNTGAAITGFKAGPFRIGYLGFPVGGLIGPASLDRDLLQNWKTSRFPVTLHCLRIPVSAFDSPVDLQLPFQQNPETAITNLQQWDLASTSKKLRRDVKKAMRSDLIVKETSDPVVGRKLFAMYEDTVRRRSGSLRYNESYFSAVVALARTSAGLRCLTAWLDDEIAGFVVVARHGPTSYYLHGGTRAALKHHNPSDLLLYEAICRAKEDGSQCFNLMTSSIKQPSLIRYKEKWGAITRQHTTYTLSLNPLFCPTFRLAEKIYSLIR
jgi:hypothetical protein